MLERRQDRPAPKVDQNYYQKKKKTEKKKEKKKVFSVIWDKMTETPKEQWLKQNGNLLLSHREVQR